MMMSKLFIASFIALGSAIGIGVGLKFSLTELDPSFEKPWLYHSLFFTFEVFGKISAALDYFNYEKEYVSHQLILNCMYKEFYSADLNSLDIEITTETYRGVKVRIYKPKELENVEAPVMVYIHGNFRAFGTLESYDLYLSKLSKKIKMKIISIDYRLPPRASFTVQVSDCLNVMNYILKGARNLDIDLNRLIIAGDSEGGHISLALITQLYNTQRFVPKLHVLIYSSMQFFNLRLPSSIKYQTGLVGAANINSAKLALWNLGIKNFSTEMESAISSNNHIALINDEELIKKYTNYMNLVRIYTKYKQDSPLYNGYQPFIPKIIDKVFEEDEKFSAKARELFKNEMSPSLVDTKELMVAPHTYFIVCEMDGLRDEQLLYAERLKSVSRPVEIAFYKNGFHGMAPMLSSKWGFKLSRKMLKDLARYISKNV